MIDEEIRNYQVDFDDIGNISTSDIDNISISDSLKDLMNNTDTNDLSGMLSSLGTVGNQLDIKSMLPQIMMGLIGQQGKGRNVMDILANVRNIGNDYDYEDDFLNHHREIEENTKVRGIGHLRAAIPYLDPSLQRHFAVYIKLIELQNVVKYYTTTQIPFVERGNDWQRNMMLSMRHFSDNGTQFEKYLRIMDMYKVIKNIGGIK